MTVPILKARKPKPKKKLADLVEFGAKPPSKKDKKLARPSEQMPERKERKQSAAKGLAQAAMAMPGRGTAGRILKGALAGAAAGATIEESYREYKKGRAKSKAKKAKLTASQSAMSQKAKYHKKDPTSTEKH